MWLVCRERLPLDDYRFLLSRARKVVESDWVVVDEEEDVSAKSVLLIGDDWYAVIDIYKSKEMYRVVLAQWRNDEVAVPNDYVAEDLYEITEIGKVSIDRDEDGVEAYTYIYGYEYEYNTRIAIRIGRVFDEEIAKLALKGDCDLGITDYR
jgi:hypothetical protein